MSLFVFAWGSDVAARDEAFDVTLVTQASLDRVWLMAELCERWPGPIVLVAFVPEESPFRPDHVLLPAVCRGGRGLSVAWSNSSTFGRREKARVQSSTFFGATAQAYPVNYLRNLGLSMVHTSHFLVADIDFVPSRGLYEEIRRHAPILMADPLLTVVVPAFQRRGGSCSSVAACRALAAQTDFLPATLEELQRCMVRPNNGCIVFQADNNYDGHGTTRSQDWLSASAHWLAPKPLPCFESSRYEPYLVIPTSGAHTPRYDERFVGYGKNKIQYVNHVRYAGFKFQVLPREFLMHFPHPKSVAKLEWLRNSSLHRQVDQQFSSFVEELSNQYGSSPTTHICSPAASSRGHLSTVAKQRSREAITEAQEKLGTSFRTRTRQKHKKSLLSALSSFFAGAEGNADFSS